MIDFTGQALWLNAAILTFAAALIAAAGSRLSGVCAELAARTGMGQVMAGAVFVGASTSLPGIVTSMSTAAQSYPGLAIGNALGGLTAQTAFLAVADLVYRRANLEHAAASATTLAQSALLMTLLTMPLLAMTLPELTVFSVHPATPLLFVIYVLGVRLLARVKAEPMWSPVQTEETEETSKGEQKPRDRGREQHYSWRRLWMGLAIFGTLTAFSGYIVGQASIGLVATTAIPETAIGTAFTAVANSLPELVTAIAAVRRGAPNLAVGGIIGGNSFEVLFLAVADIFYRPGSIYSEMTSQNVFTAMIAILMTGVLLLGLLRRQQAGIARIGFESGTVLALYAFSLAMLMAF